MLQELRIDNFALIDQAKISFKQGFTVITGETGSGKSILLHALNLILGERADFSVIGPEKDKSVVEADINIAGFALQHFFSENELDYQEETLIRREIHKNGRSRAFVNDTPVSLQLLKELTSQLLHIHSQYNTLELKDKHFQLEILDLIAGIQAKRDQYSKVYYELTRLENELAVVNDRLQFHLKEEDFTTFQLNEIKALKLDKTNYRELADQLRTIENADELKSLYEEILSLNDADSPYQTAFTELTSRLHRKRDVSELVSSFAGRMSSLMVELKDLALEAQSALDSLEVDSGTLDALRFSLDEYNKVLFKHRLQDQEALMNLEAELSSQVTNTEELTAQKATLEKRILVLKEEVIDLADEIHSARLDKIPAVEQVIQVELDQLKLENTQLRFELSKRENLNKMGCSDLEITFAPNLGLEPVPIHKAASGGELSRVMLALQHLVSKHTRLQTVLFDEIDTGVSGDVAAKIGVLLRKMGESMQVIAITHLPQVAAKGQHHLIVEKNSVGTRTLSRVKELESDDRVDEIARLMSGDQITESAKENAKVLMQ